MLDLLSPRSIRLLLGVEPQRIIFNDPATIAYWSDGSKSVVKSSGEKYIPEFGFAMCLVKKLFPSRGEFLRIIESAQYQKSDEKEK